jgi:hypothetical protein
MAVKARRRGGTRTNAARRKSFRRALRQRADRFKPTIPWLKRQRERGASKNRDA